MFRDLITGRLEGKRVGRYAIIRNNNSVSFFNNRKLLPTLSSSLIREGGQARQNIRLGTCHCALVAQSHNYLPQGAGIMKREKESAFTLAEVLITLGIIGVVAAMTMPALINQTNKKELHVAFQKTYSELNQAAKLYQIQNGTTFSEDFNSTSNPVTDAETKFILDDFIKLFNGGIKYSSSNWTNQGDIPSYDIYSLNNKTKGDGTVCNATGYYTNNTGKIYSFNDRSNIINENGPIICVDTNGKKRPNRYGYDVFLFLFTIDGYVIPMGQQHPNNPKSDSLNWNGFVSGQEYCTYSKNSNEGGYACAYYALQDRSPEDETKSYWKDFLR